MAELMTNIDNMVSEERQKKVRAVKEWLATGSPPKDDHEAFLKVREEYPSTGHWVLRQEYVMNWMDADIPVTSLIWMIGIPGAGMFQFRSSMAM